MDVSMIVIKLIFISVEGYLIGSLNGALLISGFLLKDDVRKHGSGNAGLTNSLRTYGVKVAILVAVIDVTKMIMAVIISGWVLGKSGYHEEGIMISGTFALIGHMFPLYFKFKGGKGILSGAALAFMLDWRVFAFSVGIFIIIVVVTRIVSLGSLAAAVMFPVSTLFFFWGSPVILLMTAFCSCLIIYMHRENIKRIRAGTESKLSFSKKGKG